MSRIKVIYKKNLRMSEGKVAAQVAHAAMGLAEVYWEKDRLNIAVLGVSNAKFEKLVKEQQELPHIPVIIQTDLGLTEVAEGTVTAAAWIEH